MGSTFFFEIMAKKPLPDHIQKDRAAYVSCIAGAILKEEYESILNAAGLTSMSSIIMFLFFQLSQPFRQKMSSSRITRKI